MKKISRRSFLMATGVIAASAALSACGGSSASTSSAGRVLPFDILYYIVYCRIFLAAGNRVGGDFIRSKKR